MKRILPQCLSVSAILAGCLCRPAMAQNFGCAIPEFSATRAYPVGGVGFSVVTADFNGDGKADVAVVVGALTNTVQIFLGNGDGTLQPPISYTPITFPNSLLVIDVNHDNNPDLVVGDIGQLYLMIGNGNGTFQPVQSIPASSAYAFAFGQLDADTNLDLVASDSANGITIWKGNGAGAFSAGNSYSVVSQESPSSIAIADMNGDGNSDIVVGTLGTGSGHVAVLLGNGKGVFAPGMAALASPHNSSLAIADFDRDGTNDVAVGNYDTGLVSIYLGKGDGTLRSNGVYSVGIHLSGIAIADFNGDGTNDLVVATAGAVSILLGRGYGTFQPGPVLDGLWQSVAVADFNRDGKLDLASDVQAGSGKIGLTLGRGDGTFKTAMEYGVGSNPQFVAVGDLNGDGHPDLAVANFGTTNVSVLLNNGDGTYRAARNYLTPFAPQGIAIGDFNGDGTNDLIVSTLTGTNEFTLLINKGDGTFQPPLNFGNFGGGPIAVGDFNGDRKLDVLVSSLLSGLQVQLGNGKGSFVPSASAAGINAFGFGPTTLAVGDFNGDTNLDFAIVTSGGDSVVVGLGKGDGAFLALTTNIAGIDCQGIVAGDFNGDGKLDLAVADNGTAGVGNGSVSILLGNGNGTFKSAVHYSAGADPLSVSTGDFNGDGKLDLAVRYLAGFGIGILLGNGDGTFQDVNYFGSLNDATYAALAVSDLNADGKPDVVLLDLTNRVSVMLNDCVSSSVPSAGLTISQSLASALISWPISAADLQLESTTNLALPDWQPIRAPLATNSTTVRATVPFGLKQQFFRLH